MTDNTFKDEEFLDLADSFIALANQHCAKLEPGKVSAAFLYAAARFNTFIVASSASDQDSFKEYQDKAIKYFLSEYEKMLKEHMHDYGKNFHTYMKQDSGDRTIN